MTTLVIFSDDALKGRKSNLDVRIFEMRRRDEHGVMVDMALLVYEDAGQVVRSLDGAGLDLWSSMASRIRSGGPRRRPYGWSGRLLIARLVGQTAKHIVQSTPLV
jgi:hypothetical protein